MDDESGGPGCQVESSSAKDHDLIVKSNVPQIIDRVATTTDKEEEEFNLYLLWVELLITVC